MSWISRIYNWVTDRDNGVPITASRMDAEFDNIIAGMNTLHNDLATNEWVAEQNAFSRTSGTVFQVAGVDETAIYHDGRRVKVVHNGGATTVYGTVVFQAFSGGNTNVTIQTDNNSPLTGIITELYYGLLSFTNNSYLRAFTRVDAQLSSDQTFSTGTPQVVTFDHLNADTLGEMAAGVFMPKTDGVFIFTATVYPIIPSGTMTEMDLYFSGLTSNAKQSLPASLTSAFTGGLTVSEVMYVTSGTPISCNFVGTGAGCSLDSYLGSRPSFLRIASLR